EGGGCYGHSRYKHFRRSPQPQQCWHAFHRLLLSQRSHHPCLKERRRLKRRLYTTLDNHCRKPSSLESIATRHALQRMRANLVEFALRKHRNRSTVQNLSDVPVFHF